MTKQNNFAVTIVLAVIAVAAVLAFVGAGNAHADNAYTSTQFSRATTSTAFTVTTSTRILATSTRPYTRVYATVCNPNANPVYLNLNADNPANATSASFVIAAAAGYQACYEVNGLDLYQGAVQASSTGETPTKVFVTDYWL